MSRLTITSRRSFLLLTTTLVLVACDERERPARCPTCGMPVSDSDRFRVEGRADDGSSVLFDSPKCAFRWAGGSASRRARDLAFTEYYSQKLTSISKLSFVVGSAVMSPMGSDLVPVQPDKAAGFTRDHGGRVLTADAVDAEVLRALDGT